MLIYTYRNWISSDKDKLEEKILNDVSKFTHDIGTAESIAEDKYSDIEELDCSVTDVFDYMKQGYIFLEYCGVMSNEMS